MKRELQGTCFDIADDEGIAESLKKIGYHQLEVNAIYGVKNPAEVLEMAELSPGYCICGTSMPGLSGTERPSRNMRVG